MKALQRRYYTIFTCAFNALMLPLGICCVYSMVALAQELIHNNDFVIYSLAAEALRNGGDPYSVRLTKSYAGGLEVEWGYIYPPFIATLLSLLFSLGASGAKVAWAVLTTTGILTTAFVLRQLKMVTHLGVGWTAILLAVWPVAVDGFEEGQVDGMVLGLLAAFLLALHRNYPKIAGIALALAVHIKVTPLYLALLLLNRRFVHARITFITSLAAIWIGITLVCGIQPWLHFFSTATNTVAGGAQWLNPWNHAISKSLFLLWPPLGMRAALWIQHTIVACGVLILVRDCRAEGEENLTRNFCRLTVLLFVSSPIVWFHHALWLIFAIVWSWNNNRNGGSRALVVALVVTMTLGGYIGLLLGGRELRELEMFAPLEFLIGALSLWVLLEQKCVPSHSPPSEMRGPKTTHYSAV